MMGQGFLSRVIDMYRELPCLWNTAHENYHNREERGEALDQLQELFKEVDPDATRDCVLKRINSLRGGFRKELNKIRVSKQSTRRGRKVHEPKLWYFKRLMFLEGGEDLQESQSVTSTNSDDMHNGDKKTDPPSHSLSTVLEDLPSDDDEETEPLGGGISFVKYESDSNESTSRSSTSQPKSKKARLTKHYELMSEFYEDDMQETMETLSQEQPVSVCKQSHNAFGLYVAEKLRFMPPDMVPICQKIINEAIYYAETNALNSTSRINKSDV